MDLSTASKIINIKSSSKAYTQALANPKKFHHHIVHQIQSIKKTKKDKSRKKTILSEIV